ncbi:MAG: sugar ABC transporter ATP-binding protein [Clostridiales bacterium]|nr:sugar ABC transporter ATP-binding protein [Clostridiales bacterium]
MNEELILSLRGIEKSFGGVHALNGVDFELRRGEVHALLGENGAGKSTLIKILTGVHRPDTGEILLRGNPVTIADPIDARRRGIAAIYQELSLIDTLTVAENIFLGNEPVVTPLGVSRTRQLYADSEAFLKRFGIAISSHAVVGDLGLGQKRVIEIVKALAINAEILLLDEPTTGMSRAEIDTLFGIMASLKEKNVTMIYISHYLDEVFRCCDRATVFRDGRNVGRFQMAAATVPELVRAMIGHTVSGERYRPAQTADGAETVIEARWFQSAVMRHPVSFRVGRGEIVGFTGIVGAGKSELAGSLFGAHRKTGGELLLHGKPVRFRSPHDTRAYGMAYIPEDRKSQGLILSDSVEDNIVLPHIEQIENRLGLLISRKKRAIAQRMGERVRLQPPDVRMKAGNLSGGNQQKVVLGKWLTAEPDIILLDEPTRGIDIGAKAEIYRLMTQMADAGKTVLVFSSEMEELLSICDRILILCKGGIVGEKQVGDATVESLLTLALGADCDE